MRRKAPRTGAKRRGVFERFCQRQKFLSEGVFYFGFVFFGQAKKMNNKKLPSFLLDFFVSFFINGKKNRRKEPRDTNQDQTVFQRRSRRISNVETRRNVRNRSDANLKVFLEAMKFIVK